MKRCKLFVAVLSLSILPAVLTATPISGSIAFTGGATVNSGLTAFVSYSALGTQDSEPVVLGLSQIGDYAGVPAETGATWSPFTFHPPAASVMPLWSMTFGGITYSFTATSMTVNRPDSTIVCITGTGIAHITGFDDTLGTWEVTATTPRSLNFTFCTSAQDSGTAVPDGGTTVALLGVALAGVSALRRRLA